MARQAHIVGVAETRFARNSELSDLQLMSEAIALALHDAGTSLADVDGLAIGTMNLLDPSPFLAEHLGLELGWVMKGDFGGASGVSSIIRAKHAIETGYVDVVVCAGGGNRNAKLEHDKVGSAGDYSRRSFVEPLGYGGPNSLFGLIQRRHMFEHGTTLEQLGKIAVTQRRHAQLNDNALLRDDMTIDDYLASRMIADPIRLLDCVMPASGGSAVVLAASDRPRLGSHPGVAIETAAENFNHQVSLPLPDRLSTGMRALAGKLFDGLSPDQMDFVQLYDDYPMAVLMQLEDLGFTKKGHGGHFVEETDLSFSGELPLNTGGGQLSVGQPRAAGGYIGVVEAVRQLQGRAGRRQIHSPRRGVVTGIGHLAYSTNLACTSAVVLANTDGADSRQEVN